MARMLNRGRRTILLAEAVAPLYGAGRGNLAPGDVQSVSLVTHNKEAHMLDITSKFRRTAVAA